MTKIIKLDSLAASIHSSLKTHDGKIKIIFVPQSGTSLIEDKTYEIVQPLKRWRIINKKRIKK